jgi:hypothetical protein
MIPGQISQAWEQGPVTLRALRSLTPPTVDAVRSAITNVPGHWAIEQHDDYDGYLSILISPERDNENDQPTFLISGTIGQVELAQSQSDHLHTLGRFPDVDATIAALIKVLTAPKTAQCWCSGRRSGDPRLCRFWSAWGWGTARSSAQVGCPR